MKIRILIITISTFIFCNSKAQNKIGYVSVEKIFVALPETKKADSALAAFQEALSKTYQEQQSDLEAGFNKFIKDSATMTPQARAVYRKKLEDAVTEHNDKGKEFDKMLLEEKEKMAKPIREKIFTAIQEYAKQNGYAHILYENNALVLNAEDDITSKIVDKLKVK